MIKPSFGYTKSNEKEIQIEINNQGNYFGENNLIYSSNELRLVHGLGKVLFNLLDKNYWNIILIVDVMKELLFKIKIIAL